MLVSITHFSELHAHLRKNVVDKAVHIDTAPREGNPFLNQRHEDDHALNPKSKWNLESPTLLVKDEEAPRRQVMLVVEMIA